MSRVLLLNALFVVTLPACVTVTVNFPAATAAEAPAEQVAQKGKDQERLHSASELSGRQNCVLARQPLCLQRQAL
jgi:hypothetical protein